MALTIDDADIERLAAEAADLAGESQAEAVRKALTDRIAHLRSASPQARRERIERLVAEIHTLIPPHERGRVMTKEEEEEILGFGPNGV